MIFDIKTVAEAFKGLVGFSDYYNTDLELTSDLTTSRSGLRVDSVHPVIDPNVIRYMFPDPILEQYTYLDASTAITAKAGTLVNNAGEISEVLRDLDNEIPDPADIQKASWVSHQLRRHYSAAVEEALMEWSNNQSILKSSKAVTQSNKTNRYPQEPKPSTLNGRYFGVYCVPSKEIGEVNEITKIRLCLSENQNVDIIEVDEEGNSVTHTIAYDGAGQPKWYDIDITVGQLLKTLYIDSESVSGSIMDCHSYTQPRGNRVFKHFNSNKLSYWDESTTNADTGIALKYRTVCDITDFIIENEDVFARIINYAYAIRLLRLMATNPHSIPSRYSTNIDAKAILFQIDGTPQGFREVGIGLKYTKALDAVHLDVAGLSKACLKCGKSNTVSYGSVFG